MSLGKIMIPAVSVRRLAVTALVCACAMQAATASAQVKPFAITGFTMQTTQAGAGGVSEPYLFVQAAGHPFALTSTVQFASEGVGAEHTLVPSHEPKDVIIDLPPGLVANPQAVAHCPVQSESCPADTQVGVFVLRSAQFGAILGPIVNRVAPVGQAAELGLETEFKFGFQMAGRLVRTAQGYGLAIVASDLPTVGVVSIETTLWGVPGANAHNPQRGLFCKGETTSQQLTCQGGGEAGSEEPTAFLTMPSDCSTPTQTGMGWADSWEEPGRYVQAQSTLPEVAYCERLPFSPEIVASPETPLADAPDGVNVSIQVPQIGAGAVVATPPLRDVSVTLPEGLSINPSVASGLQACPPTGASGINIPTGVDANGEPLAPGEVGSGEALGPNGEPQLTPGNCPKESIVGTAEATTPLLAHPIEGRIYIATPACGNPGQGPCTERDAVDGDLYRLYIELGAGANTKRNEGVLIKLTATIQANPATGQLTVRLTESPQLPLSELSLHLLGGDRALLANPSTCGRATTTSQIEPWSAPYKPGTSPTSYYDVTGCSNSPLNLELLAGSVNASAGASSPFTINVTRHPGEPYLAAIQTHTPPGLSAQLSSVPVCEESLATSGGCGETSRIGNSQVAIGSGSQPLYLPGSVYLTGPYEDAPFGLSIVTNAQAGPLNLGMIVIRARIDIDPQTAALMITTDPLPQIVLGVPLRIQRVSLNIDRANFIINPTNCEAQQVTATIADVQGTSDTVSNRFALGDCKSLAFKPKLTASTSARTSYRTGASLSLDLTFPKADQGTQANLAQIKVALPKQLPSRLTTLQNACTQTTFNANPAACPQASVVGVARAQTPILPTPLSGPVYFVTHGHDAFPSPTIVLQANGVRLNLSGSTIIDKAGVASVSFNAIPDVPINNLQLYLPEGPHSLLSANANLCGLAKTVTVKRTVTQRAHGRIVHRTVRVRERLPASLAMPTELIAHNGAVAKQTTKIQVSGCTADKAKTSAVDRRVARIH